MFEIKFNDIDGIRLGHAHNQEAATGCTVIICDEGASGGVDVRGGSPGTRETDLLNPVEFVDRVHSIVLSGGSAFGLDASAGVMKYLEEKSIGFDVGVTKVPIVCSAVLFDLVIGSSSIRPDKNMGYEACKNSENYYEDLNGNIGAGMGATIGKIKGLNFSMKGGLGTYTLQIGELQVGAIVAVNALGDIYDSDKNSIIAGVMSDDKKSLDSTEKIMISQYDKKNNVFSGNTTIGVIVTNAKLNKAQASKVATMAQNGFGRAIRPAHTMFDGDTIFSLCTNKVDADINVVGLLAAKVMEKAILNGITEATSLHGVISLKEFERKLSK